MTIKFGLRHLLLIVLCSFLWNQQANNLYQKIGIENSYRDKVSHALSRLLGQEKFLVIVSIEFSSIGGTLKKTAALQSGTSSSGEFFPGIPTVPSIRGTQPSYGSSSQSRSDNDLDIGRIEVIIELDEASISVSVKQQMKSLVEKIIPQTKDCDDCIKIEAMAFLTKHENIENNKLRRELDSLKTEFMDLKLTADDARLAELNAKLTEKSNRNDELEALETLRQLQQIKEDSLEFVLMRKAETIRRYQDSLRFINTEKRLERVMESKIKSDSVIIHETLSIVKQQAGGGKEDESLLGMQLGSRGSGIMGSVIFILLIIALMVVTYLVARNKRPKTIYLKPKSKEKEKAKDKKGGKKKKAGDAEPEESPEPAAPTPPRQDEDALRSELRSLRQTAVSLTVGEKEGASALIREWLEDNPNKSDEGEEEAGEE